MQLRVIIEAEIDYPETRDDIVNALDAILPYMASNVTIKSYTS